MWSGVVVTIIHMNLWDINRNLSKKMFRFHTLNCSKFLEISSLNACYLEDVFEDFVRIVVHVVRCYFRMAKLLIFDADTLTMGPLIRSRFVREFTSICQLLGGSHYNMAAVGMRFLLFFKWKRHLNMVYSY